MIPYRSNIPHLSQFCFYQVDPEFSSRAKQAGKGIILAGANYGQGSSREHAALVPLYLGIRAVIAVSFARIHKANLINAGILPFTFANAEDYAKVDLGDNALTIHGLAEVTTGKTEFLLTRSDEGDSNSACTGLLGTPAPDFTGRRTAWLHKKSEIEKITGGYYDGGQDYACVQTIC